MPLLLSSAVRPWSDRLCERTAQEQWHSTRKVKQHCRHGSATTIPRLLENQFLVRIRAAVAEELPDVADFADQVEIEVGDDYVILGAFALAQ